MNLPNKVLTAGIQRASRLPAGILTRNVLDYAKDRPRDVPPAALARRAAFLSLGGARPTDTELERLNIALKENILAPEVIAEGYGGVDAGRLDKAINQIGLTYPFKAKPKPDEAFDASFLPDAAERKTR